MITGMTTNDAWRTMLTTVMVAGHDTQPRGLATKEILSYTSRIDMARPIMSLKKRADAGKYFAFMFGEAYWILTGKNTVSDICSFSKMIKRFSDDGRYFFGAYGPKILDQVTHVVNALVKDPDSRQAVINIWRESPPPTKDIPCTISVQFLYRDGYLHCFDTMRSSDAWLGWPYDVFNFSALSCLVCLLIRERGGFVGRDELPACPRLGTLHLTAASQHIYATNFESVDSILLDGGIGVKNAAENEYIYKPIDPSEFESVDSFLAHLKALADFQLNGSATTHARQPQFLSEFMVKHGQ